MSKPRFPEGRPTEVKILLNSTVLGRLEILAARLGVYRRDLVTYSVLRVLAEASAVTGQAVRDAVRPGGTVCEFGGCGRARAGNGLCVGHGRQRRLGQPLRQLRFYRRRAGHQEAGG